MSTVNFKIKPSTFCAVAVAILARAQVMALPRGRPGSWEEVCHRVAGPGGKMVVLLEEVRQDPLFKRRIGHRAVGVVYDPKAEKYGNYVPSVVAERWVVLWSRGAIAS